MRIPMEVPSSPFVDKYVDITSFPDISGKKTYKTISCKNENKTPIESQEDSSSDAINELGNMAKQTNDAINELGNMAKQTHEPRAATWDLNYQEAAIYLQEGENNDKYNTHPKNKEDLSTFKLAHHAFIHSLDLFAALFVLLLVACERPAINTLRWPIGVHGSLEIFGLLLLCVELGIRMKWLGWRTFIRHPRTVIKTLVMLVMLVEATAVLIRQTNHFRITRALRPIFLINSHYCRGVRRLVRQILQSLPRIFDMLLLLLFIMLIFSILGYYLFSPIPKNVYFATLQDSFVSLFILLTTANYPDVMMAAYNVSRFYALFFVSYLAIELYFVMNLFLAVVYDTFSGFEKMKFKKLFLHKRERCKLAFRLLTTKKDQQHINLQAFIGVLKYFRSSLDRKEGYLVFKTLNKDKKGKLSLEEFYHIYDFCDLKWMPKCAEDVLWSSNFRRPFDRMFADLHWFATWKWFGYFMSVVIIANLISILVETILFSMQRVAIKSNTYTLSYISVAFACVYSIEAMIKILGKGPKKYFSSGWDIFDFLVTVCSLAGILAGAFADSFYYVIVLRPLRLLRSKIWKPSAENCFDNVKCLACDNIMVTSLKIWFSKIKKRYNDVLGTFFMLANRMASLVIVIILVYYFFAVIGMEVFLNTDLTNCCKNTIVESEYAFTNTSQGFYYMNNFNNILISGVTLFELTVVNNWYIHMEGYAHHVGEVTRIFFMLFYIVMMVVMNIVVAFVLELFMFRITYRRTMNIKDIDDHLKLRVKISLNKKEEDMCTNNGDLLTGNHVSRNSSRDVNVQTCIYKGERLMSKEDFSLQMYCDVVKEWIEESEHSKKKQGSYETLDEIETF